MSRWNHNICQACWDNRSPDRDPVRDLHRPEHLCCFCGAVNVDGIFVRHDPSSDEIICGGEHEARTEG